MLALVCDCTRTNIVRVYNYKERHHTLKENAISWRVRRALVSEGGGDKIEVATKSQTHVQL